MKVHKVSESENGVLYELSEPAHNYVDCTHYDDDEVNAANVVDVRSCADIVYNYLLVKESKDKVIFFPADNFGKALSSPVLVGDKEARMSEHLIKLYGNMVVLEHHLADTPSRNTDFDEFNFHPDHAI